MTTEKKLYRSRDSLISGVCTGIAQYFSVDPIVVQVLTVILTILTAGLLAIAYIALWIILPREPDPSAPVDVEPQEVHSETYGQVDYNQGKANGTAASRESAARDYSAPYTSAAHVPPPPPSEYANNPQAGAAKNANGRASSAQTANTQPPNGQPYSTQPPNAQAYAAHASQNATPNAQAYGGHSGPQRKTYDSSANGALWVGLALLFIGICALLGVFVTGVAWWQFWPLVLVIAGIGQMVVPGPKGHRMGHFVNGLIQFSFGAALLPFSLGVITLGSIWPIVYNLWPILLIMCGFFVLRGALNSPIFTLLAGLSFVVFCVVGIGWFSIPGATDFITLNLPTGQAYTFDINPWI